MAKNKIQDGRVLALAALGAVAAGQVVIIGSIVGAALNSAANAGDELLVDTEGVYEFDKKDSADAITQGLVVYATAAGKIDKEATDNVKAGYAVEAAGNGTTTVKVRLVPMV